MIFKKKSFSMGAVDYIVAGLGNPGLQYENTRHNAGYMAIDTISNALHIKPDRLKFKSICTETEIDGKRILFLKPTT